MPTTDALQQQINALTQRVDAITAPPTNYYTHRYSGEEIDNGVQGGLLLGIPSSKQQALRNIGGRPNRNLLDNWYFVGGGSQQGGGQFPINQRGQTSYTNVTRMMYGIDRWLLDWYITLELASGYISTNKSGIFQPLPNEKISLITGKTVTLSALDAYGNLSVATGVYDGVNNITSSDGSVTMYFNHGGKPATFRVGGSSVVACKLELGPVQTLAYQDEDGNWQLFETPSFQEEQAKCQAYQVGINTLDEIGVTNNATTLYVNIPTPVTMRALPAIENNGVFSVRGGGTNQANLTATIYSSSLNANGIRVGIAGQFTVNEPYHVSITSPIILNANL